MLLKAICLKYAILKRTMYIKQTFCMICDATAVELIVHESQKQLYWHVYVFDQHSLIGKKVQKGFRQIHGCSASPRIPTQALSFLGGNRMPELLWDVVSSWGLWNRWFSADRDRHWSPIIPSERNLCRTTPAWSSRLDCRASRRRSGWFRGFSRFWAAKGLETVKATELPRFLSGLLEANEWPWAVVRAGTTRIRQWWQLGAAAATPESPHTARPAAFCLSQETEDRWGSDIRF